MQTDKEWMAYSWHVHFLFHCVGNRHMCDELHNAVLNAFLVHDLGNIHFLLNYLRHWHLGDVLNSAMLDAFVHKHVSVMLHVLMNLPLFLDNGWGMRFLSHSVGNWHVLDVFHLTVLNALLLNNLWHLRYFQQSVARAHGTHHAHPTDQKNEQR